MRNKLFIFLLILSFITSCKSQHQVNNKDYLLTKYNVNKKVQSDWVLDTNGCKGFRGQYFDEIKKNATLIGISVKELTAIFGKPDDINNKDIFKKYDTILIYFLSSDCTLDNKVLFNNTFTQIHFMFIKDKLEFVDFIIGN